MPDITKEQYEASRRDKTCVVGGEPQPWWGRLGFGGWAKCDKCQALHCGAHHSKEFKHGYILAMRHEWRCWYCGEVNMVSGGGGG